jgi:hypothetical protein
LCIAPKGATTKTAAVTNRAWRAISPPTGFRGHGEAARLIAHLISQGHSLNHSPLFAKYIVFLLRLLQISK